MNIAPAIQLLEQAIGLLRKAGFSVECVPHASFTALVEAQVWSINDKIMWARALGCVDGIQNVMRSSLLGSNVLNEDIQAWVTSVNSKKPWYQSQVAWWKKRQAVSHALFVRTQHQHEHLQSLVQASALALEALQQLQQHTQNLVDLQQNLSILIAGFSTTYERLNALLTQHHTQMQSMILFHQANQTLDLSQWSAP